MTSEEELTEWQPAIITWGCGEPKRPECRMLLGRKVHVRQTEKPVNLQQYCSGENPRWFAIRMEDLPSELQPYGNFIICEHDLVTD